MTRRATAGFERRLEALETRQEPPTSRLALDDDVPDELVGRIIQSSRSHLDDPTDREVALESIRELQRREMYGGTPRFE